MSTHLKRIALAIALAALIGVGFWLDETPADCTAETAPCMGAPYAP